MRKSVVAGVLVLGLVVLAGAARADGPVVIPLDPKTGEPYPEAKGDPEPAKPVAEPLPNPVADKPPAEPPPTAVEPPPTAVEEEEPAAGADAAVEAAAVEAAAGEAGEGAAEAAEGEAAVDLNDEAEQEFSQDSAELRGEFADDPNVGAAPSPDSPTFEADYAKYLKGLVGAVRGKVMSKIKAKIADKQAKNMDRISGVLGLFSLCGLLLLFMPFVLIKKHPGKMGVLFKYSALAAVTFVVAVNLFTGVLMMLRGAQGALGEYTNPQVRIVTAAFDTIDEKAKDLALVGPMMIEPTLAQLSGAETDEPLPLALIGNIQKLKNDMKVFTTVGNFFKSVNWVFGYLPIVLTLLALLLFVLATKPVLLQIIKLPDRAAGGEAGVAKQIIKDTFRRIWREVLATLCVIGVLTLITIMSGLLLSYVLKPAIEAFMAWLIICALYVQVVPAASSTTILISLVGTILFLVCNLAVIILSSAFFLGKAQKIFQQRFQDRVPLRTHKKFWTWGTLSLVWIQAFPLLYILAAKPLVEKIIDKTATGKDGAPNWTAMLTYGPVLLVTLFLFTFWAARGVKALGFLKKYPVKGPAPQVVVAVAEEVAMAAEPITGGKW